jgi:hypothetical protein
MENTILNPIAHSLTHSDESLIKRHGRAYDIETRNSEQEIMPKISKSINRYNHQKGKKAQPFFLNKRIKKEIDKIAHFETYTHESEIKIDELLVDTKWIHIISCTIMAIGNRLGLHQPPHMIQPGPQLDDGSTLNMRLPFLAAELFIKILSYVVSPYIPQRIKLCDQSVVKHFKALKKEKKVILQQFKTKKIMQPYFSLEVFHAYSLRTSIDEGNIFDPMTIHVEESTAHYPLHILGIVKQEHSKHDLPTTIKRWMTVLPAEQAAARITILFSINFSSFTRFNWPHSILCKTVIDILDLFGDTASKDVKNNLIAYIHGITKHVPLHYRTQRHNFTIEIIEVRKLLTYLKTWNSKQKQFIFNTIIEGIERYEQISKERSKFNFFSNNPLDTLTTNKDKTTKAIKTADSLAIIYRQVDCLLALLDKTEDDVDISLKDEDLKKAIAITEKIICRSTNLTTNKAWMTSESGNDIFSPENQDKLITLNTKLLKLKKTIEGLRGVFKVAAAANPVQKDPTAIPNAIEMASTADNASFNPEGDSFSFFGTRASVQKSQQPMLDDPFKDEFETYMKKP